jgi:RND family efflux transporter MFP subunit
MIAIARRWHLVPLFAVGVLVVSAAVLLWQNLSSGSSAVAPEETVLAPVKWMESRQFFLEEWTEVFGTTQPLPGRYARITAPIEGRVVGLLNVGDAKFMSAEGQPVKKGQVVIQLDAALAKANRDKVEAAQMELPQLSRQAQYAVELAKIDVKRLEELSQNSKANDKFQLVSPIDIAKAQLLLQDAESKAQAAEMRQLAGKKEIQALDEQMLLYSLKAPIDGRLGRLLVVLGQTLPSGTLVADVIDVEQEIDVLCFVPPHVASRLKAGQAARLGTVDMPTREGSAHCEGRVEFIAEQAEPDTGNFAVKVRFPNTEAKLRSNLTLRLHIKTTEGKACLTLPESALFEDQDPPTVIVVEKYKVVVKDGKEIETGKARKLQVQLGIRDRALNLVEIIALRDPENQWKGRLEDTKFVVEKGRGLRNDDDIRLEVED